MTEINLDILNNVVENTEFIVPIPGGDGSTVSSLGIVRDHLGTIVLPKYTQGYMTISTSLHGERRRYGVHRLVLSAFSPLDGNNNNELVPNHVNGIRHDNRIENLEWVTRSENTTIEYRSGNNSVRFPIDLWNIETDVHLSFSSVREASKHPDIDVSWETVARWTSMSNDVVHKGGWRCKHPDEEWIPVDHSNLDPDSYNGRANRKETCVYDLKNNVEYIFNSQQDASVFTGLGMPAISANLSSGKQRIIENRWVVKKPIDKWREFLPLMDEIKKNDPTCSPIVMFHPDGTREEFIRISDASKVTGIGHTTICYNLKCNIGKSDDELKPTKFGYKFKYY